MPTSLILKQSDFYNNPSQESLDDLKRELEIYLNNGLTDVSTANYILVKCEEYLRELKDE